MKNTVFVGVLLACCVFLLVAATATADEDTTTTTEAATTESGDGNGFGWCGGSPCKKRRKRFLSEILGVT